MTMPSGAYPVCSRVQKSCPDRSDVNGWFAVVAPAAAGLGLDRGADGQELGDVRAPLLQLHRQPDRDDPVRAEDVGLGLHPVHRQLPGVIHRLGQGVHLLVLAPPADLQADVVDRGAEHQPERAEAGLAYQQELVHRQVRGEDAARAARLQLGQPGHGVLRQPGRRRGRSRGPPGLEMQDGQRRRGCVAAGVLERDDRGADDHRLGDVVATLLLAGRCRRCSPTRRVMSRTTTVVPRRAGRSRPAAGPGRRPGPR